MPDRALPTARLLELVGAVSLPATRDPFSVRERFDRTPGVKFSAVWNEFKKRFYGISEAPIAESRLCKYRLLTIAPDAPIIAELGGEARAEGRIAATFALIRAQGGGQPGFLQTNGYANIFYLRDLKGVLCAVRVGWDGDGWVIDAISVDDPLAWNGKHEIYCPESGAGP